MAVSVPLASVVFMKMPMEWLGKAVQARMVDPVARETAPVALWACLSSLTGGSTPLASLVEVGAERRATEWRALWLAETVLAFGAVRKERERWTAYSQGSGDHQPDDMTGWVCPLSSVVRVELDQARCWRETGSGSSEDTWMWSSAARIVVRDVDPIQIPLFGQAKNDQMDEDVRAFIDALVHRV